MHTAVTGRHLDSVRFAKHRRHVARGAVKALGVGINQQFVGIKVVADLGIPSAIDTIAVGAACRDSGHGDVIDVACGSGEGNAVGFLPGFLNFGEQAERDIGAVLGGDGKINGVFIQRCGPQRKG